MPNRHDEWFVAKPISDGDRSRYPRFICLHVGPRLLAPFVITVTSRSELKSQMLGREPSQRDAVKSRAEEGEAPLANIL
jgi:hypothetical protein